MRKQLGNRIRNVSLTRPLHVAVIGGGPTGISLSKTLVLDGFQVDLIEAGGREVEGGLLNQKNYIFKTRSLIPSNVHRLGGGSNYWIGRIGEFLPLDFQSISALRKESFPISYEDIKPYYEKAFEELAGKRQLDTSLVEQELKRLNIQIPSMLGLRIIRYSNKSFFKEALESISGNSNFTLYLNHKCLRVDKLKTDSSGEKYKLLINAAGAEVTREYDLVIICCGAMQSPALVLRSPDLMTTENSKIAGKYLMEHFDGFAGEIYLDRRKHLKTIKKLVLNRNRETKNSGGVGVALKLSESRREQLSVINLQLEISPKQRFYILDPSKAFKYAKLFLVFYQFERAVRKFGSIVSGAFLNCLGRNVYSVWVKSEILPYSESSISLSPDGMKTIYNHVVSDLAKFHFIRGLELLGQEISAARLGEFKIKPSILRGNDPLLTGENWHPMGTLRMGRNSKESVCDSDLRLYGTEKVFIADASVFPCGSNANPTFTAIALGHRLSKHLKDRFLNL